MRAAGTVLVLGECGADRLARIRAAFGAVPVEHRGWEALDDPGAMRDVRVAILDRSLDDRVLAGERLEWVHCETAGLEAAARPEVLDRGVAVTGVAGRSAAALAEHAFFFALALAYDAEALLQRQRDRRWEPGASGSVALAGRRLLVLGTGHTGRAIVRLGRAFGMRVAAANRSGTTEDADLPVVSTRDRAALLDAAGRADVLMIACALTDETRHLIGGELLGRLPAGALVVNVARGAVVDEPALIDALRDGRVGGAGLDATEIEPLPFGSPLWTLPRVLITPHWTPPQPDRERIATGILEENIRRFVAGEPLRGRLTRDDVLTPR